MRHDTSNSSITRCRPPRRTGAARSLAAAAIGAALQLCAGAAPAAADAPAVQHLRIVGGLAGVNQFTRHEEPFWTITLPRVSGGRATAEIVAFDRAGIRAQEMLRLVKLNAVPFGTLLLNAGAVLEPELAAPDLAGLNPDADALKRNVAAFRPHLQKMLRERHDVELLALYTYPAQVTFCTRPLVSLADLAGRRVRTSGASQSDWVTALGAIPVQISFAEVVASVRSGNIDCAITGTMSGNTIGLHEVTSYIHTMPVNWGVAAFIANRGAWNALSPELQALLRRELPKLEQAIWDESQRETAEGIACNVGAAACSGARKGRMTAVRETPADAAWRRDVLAARVIPAWLQRCGPSCAAVWRQTIGGATGIAVP